MPTFENWFNQAIRDVTGETQIFFNRTLPGAVTQVYKDTVGIVNSVIHLPESVLKEGGNLIKTTSTGATDIIKTTGSSATNILKAGGETAGNILNSSLFNPFVLLGAAGIAAIFLLKK